MGFYLTDLWASNKTHFFANCNLITGIRPYLAIYIEAWNHLATKIPNTAELEGHLHLAVLPSSYTFTVPPNQETVNIPDYQTV